MLLVISTDKKAVEMFYLKELQNINQKENLELKK